MTNKCPNHECCYCIEENLRQRVKQLEDALKHYTNVTNADGYPIGGVAALALAASSSPAQGKEPKDD